MIFQELLAEAARSNRDKSTQFEKLIANYLLTDPQYSDRLADVWLWEEWPYYYVVNGKSAIEWVMERYAVSVDKSSGIKNDPNEWSTDPRYIIDLVKRIARVSVETARIVRKLPALSESDGLEIASPVSSDMVAAEASNAES